MNPPCGNWGYAASLVEGYVDDPQDNLGGAIRLVTEELEGRSVTVCSFRDPVQARWGRAVVPGCGKAAPRNSFASA